MKGFTEFKGYRTRTAYDPKAKEFIARRVEYPGFIFGDFKVPTEVQVKKDIPAKPQLESQQTHPETSGEGSAKQPRRNESGSVADNTPPSSATMMRL